jgi:hypothetical protein
MKRTLQPRYTTIPEPAWVERADAQPVTNGRRPMRAVKYQPNAAARSAGVRMAARWDRHAEQIGEPLGSSPDKTVGPRPAWTKQISRREGSRVSDEAIVSDDPVGQQNPLASQGPLDRCVQAAAPPQLPSGYRGIEPELWPRISARVITVYAGLALEPYAMVRRSWLNTGLKPYWGKPDVRNVRGGGGNTGAASAPTQALKGHWVIQLRQHAVRLLSTRLFRVFRGSLHSTHGVVVSVRCFMSSVRILNRRLQRTRSKCIKTIMMP